MTMQVTSGVSGPSLKVLYAGEHRPSFEPKIKTFFERIASSFPWLGSSEIIIDSVNTFPHGAGIASSASALSALALCIVDIDDQLAGRIQEHTNDWRKRVSTIARMGSGSAARSVYPEAAEWGKAASIAGSDDEHAIAWGDHLSPIFKTYQDTLLIVSTHEKSVSSTTGHDMMSTLAYAKTRYAQAEKNLEILVRELQKEKVTDTFIDICESEALQLHALMMSGEKPFILMEPNTLTIIREIWHFRKESNIPVCFTLDAGPNVHMLYPVEHKSDIVSWMQDALIPYCADGLFIMDEVGHGPVKISVKE